MDPKDYMKQLGRDGSYAEYDVDQLHELVSLTRDGAVFPKMLVLKSSRLELTDAGQVEAFHSCLKSMHESEESRGMTEDQIGFLTFRRIFEDGLKCSSLLKNAKDSNLR